MASNYTENYGLCQWEATDQVLREEFNQDNAKLDEALFQLQATVNQKAEQSELEEVEALASKSRFMKLKEYSFPSQMTKIEIDLSDIDWIQWDKVHIDGIPTNGSQMLIYFNKVSDQDHKLYLSGWSNRYMPRITFYVGNEPGRIVLASQADTFVSDTITYSALKKVIIADGTMPEGSYFSVWGEM